LEIALRHETAEAIRVRPAEAEAAAASEETQQMAEAAR
jgi:hypothetical protein